MSQIKPGPLGRPRIYDDSAEKMAAFRARQSSAGYLRRELLLSPENAELVKEIAARQAVSVIDVVSALFEEGLAQYQAEPRSCAMSLEGSMTSCSVAAAVKPTPAVPVTDPITQFFNRRKDAKNV